MTSIGIHDREPVVVPARFRLSWGAIFAGFVVAMVSQVVFSVLGLAIGFSTFSPTGGAIGGYGIGAAIWFIVTAAISLFLGGLVLGRFSGFLTARDEMLHAVVMWGLSTVVAVWLVANGVGMLVGSTFSALAQTTGTVASGAMSAAGNLGAAAAGKASSQSELRERAKAGYDTIRSEIERRMNEMPSGGRIREAAGEVATQATRVSAAVAWIALLTMALSLGGALWGAAISSRKETPAAV